MGSNGKGAWKKIEDEVGRGGGGHVIVLRFAAQQEIAHAAAGEIGLMAGGAQCFHDMQCGIELACGGQRGSFLYCRLPQPQWRYDLMFCRRW